MPNNDLLDQWLQENALGMFECPRLDLFRIQNALAHFSLALPKPTILVGGTNGKGTSVALLVALLRAAGYQRVGAFFSPHLHAFRERIQINGQPLTNADILKRFEEIYAIGLPLTYFEYATMAALLAFTQASCEAIVLEVGLGGRLDATNAVDADIALISSIGLDHQAQLGHSREEIGWEKAHIYRANQWAVCAEPHPPASIYQHARAIGARFLQWGEAFHIEKEKNHWRYIGLNTDYAQLPYREFPTSLMAGVLAAFEGLGVELAQDMVQSILAETKLPGRFTVLSTEPLVIVDVAHNGAALTQLIHSIRQRYPDRTLIWVGGMLSDKCQHMHEGDWVHAFSEYHLAPLNHYRAASIERMQNTLASVGITEVQWHDSMSLALSAAKRTKLENTLIVATGSFAVANELLRESDAGDI